MALRYPLGISGQTLVLAEDVLTHFEMHRQMRRCDREAGGQLFAVFGKSEIQVGHATGPRLTDFRGRNMYKPDRLAEQQEIEALFADGLHYVGDWHTHPARHAYPSNTDLRCIGDCAARSIHPYNAFVMVIVGTDPSPDGLSVSLHNGEDYLILEIEREEPQVR